MRQSTVVILALFFAFAVFVTMRGELPKYLGLLGLGSSPANAASGAGGSATATTTAPTTGAPGAYDLSAALGLPSGYLGNLVGPSVTMPLLPLPFGQ